MLPAYAANMAPPLLRFWHGWNPPLNARLLGTHKTLLGFAASILAALAISAVQATNPPSVTLVDYRYWWLLGLGFGFGVACGDAVKSLFKRKRGIPPGAQWLPFDQVDYVIGSLLIVGPWAQLVPLDVLLILVVSFVGNLAVNRLAFHLKIRSTPW